MEDKSSLFMDSLEFDTLPFFNLERQQDDIFFSTVLRLTMTF